MLGGEQYRSLSKSGVLQSLGEIWCTAIGAFGMRIERPEWRNPRVAVENEGARSWLFGCEGDARVSRVTGDERVLVMARVITWVIVPFL